MDFEQAVQIIELQEEIRLIMQCNLFMIFVLLGAIIAFAFFEHWKDLAR